MLLILILLATYILKARKKEAERIQAEKDAKEEQRLELQRLELQALYEKEQAAIKVIEFNILICYDLLLFSMLFVL